MKKQEFYGVTVNVVNGKTYWQTASYRSVADLVKHVKRYSKGRKHIVVYTEGKGGDLVFVKHMDAGTY